MLVFYDLSGALWINVIPELLKPYVSAQRQVESGSTQDLDARKWDAVSWAGLSGGIQDQHQAPAACVRKSRSPRRKIPTPHRLSKDRMMGKPEDRIGSEHIPPLERRCLKEEPGKDQDKDMTLHPWQSGLQTSYGLGVTHPCNCWDLHCNGIIMQRQKSGSIIHCHLA